MLFPIASQIKLMCTEIRVNQIMGRYVSGLRLVLGATVYVSFFFVVFSNVGTFESKLHRICSKSIFFLESPTVLITRINEMFLVC